MTTNHGNARRLLLVFLAVSAWVNASEVFRYFVIVMPRMHAFRADSAPMDAGIFLIWGGWDTLLVIFNLAITALALHRFRSGQQAILAGGSLSALLFPLLWIAVANMALAPWSLLIWTLPLAWIEMLVASAIAVRLARGTIDADPVAARSAT